MNNIMKVFHTNDIITFTSEKNIFEIPNWKSKNFYVKRFNLSSINNRGKWDYLYETEILHIDTMLCPASPSRLKWEHAHIKEYKEVIALLNKIKCLL